MRRDRAEDEPRDLLTVEELAYKLSISRSLAYNLVNDGTVPSMRLTGKGKGIRIPRVALEEWIRAQTQQPK